MIVFDNASLIEGIFIKELKNRFLCEVSINDEIHECYVPSSSRLENYLKLQNKKILLSRIDNPKSRTRFSLFAVKYKYNYILLDISYANKLVASEIGSKRFSFLGKRKLFQKEKCIDGYKADIFIEGNSSTIIEVKALLAEVKHAFFPDVYSDRAVRQLQQLAGLLDKGYKAALIIIALNPHIESIRILKRNLPFYEALSMCLQKGLSLRGFACSFSNYELKLKKCIHINMEMEDNLKVSCIKGETIYSLISNPISIPALKPSVK